MTRRFLREIDSSGGGDGWFDRDSQEQNRGVDFETAMATIHGITPEGKVITGIEVFEQAYAAVGLGWMYSFAKVPMLLNVANKVYDFWAERRLQVAGRPSIAEVMEARRAREAAMAAGAGASACSLENKEACGVSFDDDNGR